MALKERRPEPAAEVRSRLQTLILDDKRRPETARLRDVFDDVERALRMGFSQADVLAELHSAGYTLTMAGFKSALQRIRKERLATPATGTVRATPPTGVRSPGFVPRPAEPGDETSLI